MIDIELTEEEYIFLKHKVDERYNIINIALTIPLPDLSKEVTLFLYGPARSLYKKFNEVANNEDNRTN